MFEIIQLLRSADAPLTANDIAGMLEVIKRTIYRDIAALQAMRVPIEGEAGIGYVMRPGFDLPPLMFTAEEVEAIVVGLALLGAHRGRWSSVSGGNCRPEDRRDAPRRWRARSQGLAVLRLELECHSSVARRSAGFPQSRSRGGNGPAHLIRR